MRLCTARMSSDENVASFFHQPRPLSPHWTSHSFRECAGGRLWPVCTEHRQKAHGGSSIITVHSWWKGTWSWADSFYRPYRDGVNHRPDDADIMPELFRSSADPHQWCRAGTNIRFRGKHPGPVVFQQLRFKLVERKY